MKKISTFLMAFILTACASTHPGVMGRSLSTEKKLPLKISGKLLTGSNEAFDLIDITLENTSNQWLRISKATVLPDESSPINVVLGKDLNSWAEAQLNQQKINEQNKDMVIGVLVLTGAALIIASNDGKGFRSSNTGQTIGTAMMGSGLGMNIQDEITKAKNKAEQSSRLPDDHLYSSTEIPGKMFLRRWVLINKQSPRLLRQIKLELEIENGTKETYAVNY